MVKPYFKIFQDRAGEWRWTLYAANHEPVATSEGYTQRASAEQMAVKLWNIAYSAVAQQKGPADVLVRQVTVPA